MFSIRNLGLLVRVAALLAGVRIALWTLPFGTLRAGVSRLAAPSGRVEHTEMVPQLCWAVRAASRLVPRATCLTQAIALHILLRRRTLPSDLRMGIAKGDSGFSSAHAWVMSGGKVVLGDGGDLHRFTPLAVWK